MSREYIVTKNLLFAAVYELDKGGSPQEVVNAIESFVLAAITEAFQQHPVTRPVQGKPEVQK